MLRSHENVLVHPSLWDDPFENFILNSPVDIGSGKLARNTLRSKVFGQCWSLTKEADLLWRAYSPHVNAVKLQTTIRAMISSLYREGGKFRDLSCFIGRVRYARQREIKSVFDSANTLDPSGAGIAETLLVKRFGFRTEREIRLIFVDHGGLADGDVMKHAFDPNASISRVVIDPRMSSEAAESISSQIRDMGYQGVVVQSGLYKPPDFSSFRLRI